jgi:hypothetical protein
MPPAEACLRLDCCNGPQPIPRDGLCPWQASAGEGKVALVYGLPEGVNLNTSQVRAWWSLSPRPGNSRPAVAVGIKHRWQTVSGGRAGSEAAAPAGADEKAPGCCSGRRPSAQRHRGVLRVLHRGARGGWALLQCPRRLAPLSVRGLPAGKGVHHGSHAGGAALMVARVCVCRATSRPRWTRTASCRPGASSAAPTAPAATCGPARPSPGRWVGPESKQCSRSLVYTRAVRNTTGLAQVDTTYQRSSGLS